MYSKDEKKELVRDFWVEFDAYCNTIPKLAKRKSKFLLYNTKMKGVELKYDVWRTGVSVVLEINLRDYRKRMQRYEQFEMYKVLVEEKYTPNTLIWNANFQRESGVRVSRIFVSKEGMDMHKRSDWPLFHEFMATEMLKLERAFITLKELIE